jgi:hypothetical protein
MPLADVQAMLGFGKLPVQMRLDAGRPARNANRFNGAGKSLFVWKTNNSRCGSQPSTALGH